MSRVWLDVLVWCLEPVETFVHHISQFVRPKSDRSQQMICNKVEDTLTAES